MKIYQPEFIATKKRIEDLNDKALIAYIEAHYGPNKKMSDISLQGFHIARLTIGLLFQEQIELENVAQRLFKESLENSIDTLKNSNGNDNK